jgi:diaminopimelate decarboxylase
MGPGWVPKIVSIGGGFAAEHDIESRVPVTDYETPTIEEYAEFTTGVFRDAMLAHGMPTDGIIFEAEPGRALHNETGLHLAKIHVVKHETANIDRYWAETDTSEVFLSIGSLNVTPPFDYVIANKADKPDEMKADLVGITCNYECMVEQAPVPKLDNEDILAFLNTGSYIEVYGCNFNALPRPAMVLVNGDQAELVKRRETLDEVFGRDVIPERLKNI